MLSQIGFNFCKDRNEHLINHHLESKWYIGGLGSGGLGFYGYSFHFTIPFTRGSFHCWIPSLTCSLLHLIQKNPPEKMAAILKVAMFLAIAFSFWLCVNFEKKTPPKKKSCTEYLGFPYSCSWMPSQKNHSLHLGLGWENPPLPSAPHKADIDPRSFWSCGILLVEFRWTFLREIFRTDIHGWTAVVWLEEMGGNGLNQGAVEILKKTGLLAKKRKDVNICW